MSIFKSGFVGVIGAPNVGKSTLMNTLIKQNLSIITDKPQTTRNRVTGILTEEDFQCIFLDTPGIMTKAKNKLDEYMINVSYSIPKEVDTVLYLIDVIKNDIEKDKSILEKIRKFKKPIILVINKIDKLGIVNSNGDELTHFDKIKTLELEYKNIYNFNYIIPISALNKINLDKLETSIKELLPIGPKYFGDDEITDQPERFFIAEFIREKIMELTKEEIPYSIAIKVEDVKERVNKLIYVRAVIYVERDSQKGIIIGQNAGMIKKIGELARVDIEDLLGNKVFLDLHVKVKENWRKDINTLKYLGYKNVTK